MATQIKNEIVRARIESKTKEQASAILKRLGVSHSTFINMSYRAVVENQGIPLSLYIPNAETRKVLSSAKQGKYSKVEDFNTLLKSVLLSKK
jgi:DNA-damage-inducible protein J